MRTDILCRAGPAGRSRDGKAAADHDAALYDLSDVPPFKVCPKCGHVWGMREGLLSDPAVALVGYQPHFEELVAGLMLFNHRTCRTTLAIEVAAFRDLYHGEVFQHRATGTAECLGLCLQRDDLRVCPARCECAYVRHILHLVATWHKGG